jgi:Tfp pilus assembly protein PilN
LLAAAIGVPALILCVGLSVKVVRDRAATGERRLEAERLEKEIAAYRVERSQLEQFFADPGTRLLTQRAAFLNAIIDQRSFPWTDLFVDLERRLPGGVHVVSLVPSLVENHVEVKMRVGALSDKSKLDFLKALESAPEFSRLELLSESRTGKNEDRDVVMLDLTAEYHPAAGSSAAKGVERKGGE